MILRSDVLTLNFYTKSPFTGSCNGMCYRIEKTTEDGKDKLKATSWPGPFCFDVTADEEKTSHLEDFTESGMNAIVAWLNQMSVKKT